jgi:hypothetical protein
MIDGEREWCETCAEVEVARLLRREPSQSNVVQLKRNRP